MNEYLSTHAYLARIIIMIIHRKLSKFYKSITQLLVE